MSIPFAPYPATTIFPADINKDGFIDLVVPHRDDRRKQRRKYLFRTRNRTFSAGISLADAKVVPYTLAIVDLNKDGKMDIIVGHVGAPSTVFFNDGSGRNFTSIFFGDSEGTVYGFAFGDFNEDGTPDIAAARSGATSVVYFGSRRKDK